MSYAGLQSFLYLKVARDDPRVVSAYKWVKNNFTLEENRIEASLVPRAELRVIESTAGHCAGAPGRFPRESAMVDAAIRDLLHG